MFGLLAKIKAYFFHFMVGLASVAVTFMVAVAYDTLVDDPAVRRDEASKLVSQAEYAALQAELALQKRNADAMAQSLEIYRKLSQNLIRDKKQLEADAEKKISEDTSEDGCRVTQEDIDWSNR